MTYTANEIEVLNGIAYHENCASNTAKPQEVGHVHTWCLAEDFSKTLKTNQVKGVLSSLVKKELIKITPYDEQDTQVHFTDLGFKVWQENDDDRAE